MAELPGMEPDYGLLKDSPESQVKLELIVNGVVVPGRQAFKRHPADQRELITITGTAQLVIPQGSNIYLIVTPQTLNPEYPPKKYRNLPNACHMTVTRVRQFE